MRSVAADSAVVVEDSTAAVRPFSPWVRVHHSSFGESAKREMRGFLSGL